MKKYLIIIVLVVLSLDIFAQAGYQGKKLSVQYDGKFFPAFIHPTYHKAPDFTTFNYQHTLSLDYVIRRRTSLGISLISTRTTAVKDQFDFDFTGDEGDIPSLKLHTKGVKLYMMFFKESAGSLAPNGKYMTLGLGMLFNTLKDAQNDISELSFQQFSTPMLSYGMGRRKVYFNRVILDHGLEVAVGYSLGEGGDNDALKQDISERIHGLFLINFKLGIGFLAH